jgi:hypothetical protein
MSNQSKYFEAVAFHVASGSSIKSAAEAAGCAERTAYNFSHLSEFRQRVNALRGEMTDRAVGELAAGAAEAVATLRQLAREGNEPSVRLQAAAKLLTHYGPMTESNEIRQRLDALESPPHLRIAE